MKIRNRAISDICVPLRVVGVSLSLCWTAAGLCLANAAAEEMVELGMVACGILGCGVMLIM